MLNIPHPNSPPFGKYRNRPWPQALLGFAAIEDVLVLNAVPLINRASLRRVCSAQRTVPRSKTAIWHIRDKTPRVVPSEQFPGFVGIGYDNEERATWGRNGSCRVGVLSALRYRCRRGVGVGAFGPCLAMRANACLWSAVLGIGRPGEQPHAAIGLKTKLSIHVPGHG